jgi:predicted dehydrogenase
MPSTGPLHIAFLGCGFITRVHSRHLRSLRSDIACSYASRDAAKADAFRAQFGGVARFASYEAAIADPAVDAVVVAVPPRFHLELALQALSAGKHVVVEKPAFVRAEDYRTVMAASVRANRTVLVGENDHYKPLAVHLRQLLREGVIGELVFAQFVSIARRLKTADDWRNDEAMAGGDAFFEEGIHWLHLAGSLGPRIVRIAGFRPTLSADGSDRRTKSMMVSFEYDSGAVGSLLYSREIPSLLRGLRVSKLFGRRGVITFESNGVCVWARGRGWPRLIVPGVADIRGYRAMYRDFVRSVRTGATPEMSLQRALEDHELMDQVYASLERPVSAISGRERLRS